MLVARNIKYVQSQKQFSRIRTAAGFALFAVGSGLLIALNNLQYFVLSYGLILAGFFLFNTGLQGITRWGRKVRNDQLVDNQLRRLSDRYTLIHYPDIGNRHPEHVLIHETGIIVMTAKEAYGRIAVEGNRYRKVGGGGFGRFFGASGPQVGQPANDNALDRKAILEALAAQAAERGWPTDFPVDGLVVFVANRLTLTGGEGANPPAVKLADVLPWVQAHTRGMPIVLTNEVRAGIADYLIASGGAATEGRIDPRGAVVPDEAAEKRATVRARPTTPGQVVKERSDRERQARARVPVRGDAATDAATTTTVTAAPRRFGRRRVEPDAAETAAEAQPVRPAAPLVPSSGMARVQRRARSKR